MTYVASATQEDDLCKTPRILVGVAKVKICKIIKICVCAPFVNFHSRITPLPKNELPVNILTNSMGKYVKMCIHVFYMACTFFYFVR